MLHIAPITGTCYRRQCRLDEDPKEKKEKRGHRGLATVVFRNLPLKMRISERDTTPGVLMPAPESLRPVAIIIGAGVVAAARRPAVYIRSRGQLLVDYRDIPSSIASTSVRETLFFPKHQLFHSSVRPARHELFPFADPTKEYIYRLHLSRKHEVHLRFDRGFPFRQRLCRGSGPGRGQA